MIVFYLSSLEKNGKVPGKETLMKQGLFVAVLLAALGSVAQQPSQPQSNAQPTQPQSASQPAQPQSGKDAAQPEPDKNTAQPQSDKNTTQPQSDKNAAQPQSDKNAAQPQTAAAPAAAQTASKGCLAVKPIGSHAFRNIMLAGVAGALISKQQYQVMDVVDYPVSLGTKYHGNDLQTISSNGIKVVILDKHYKPEELKKACHPE
jgi:cell wall-associated NlpC family hydrolase